MPWHLKTVESSTPREIAIRPARTIRVGRGTPAEVRFQDDPSMSGVHFILTTAAGLPRIQDVSDLVGTEVNGQRIQVAILQAGDMVKAGETVFTVVAPIASPYSAQLRTGGWGFESVPEGWQIVEGIGFHFSSANSFRASISAVEEPLPTAQRLRSYIEAQMGLGRTRIPRILIAKPLPIVIPGADESFELRITIPLEAGFAVLQRQIYAVSSDVVGILTATVSEAEPHAEILDSVIKGLSYFQG